MSVDPIFCGARSFDHALDILAEQAGRLGFDAVDYAYMPQVRTSDGGWVAADISARNFPARWLSGWSRFGRVDPYLWRCYERTLPLDWNEVKGAAWLSPLQRQAIAYVDDLGFRDGLTVPIHLPGGRFAFVSGLSRDPLGGWRRHEALASERFFVLAHLFHGAVAPRLGREIVAPGAGPLSPRERECLRYAAAGYSAAATAAATSRSVETVRRQRKSAMGKLNARTVTQAVASASALGLLDGRPA